MKPIQETKLLVLGESGIPGEDFVLVRKRDSRLFDIIYLNLDEIKDLKFIMDTEDFS